jgi:hypothetical protein
MDTHKITISRSLVTWALAAVALSFVVINLSMQAYRLFAHQEHVTGLWLMTLDGENNLPALFSMGLLVFASALLALITLLEHRQRAPDAIKWLLLAVGFLVMALDESLSIHEKAIEPLRAMLGHRQLGIFYFAWVIPGIALVAALGLYFLPFLLRLPRRTAIAFAISATIYLGGALGTELIEGWWREGHGHRNLTYHLLVSTEEGLEMIGAICFINALLAYLATRYREVRLGFVGAPVAEAAADPVNDVNGQGLQPQAGR